MVVNHGKVSMWGKQMGDQSLVRFVAFLPSKKACSFGMGREGGPASPREILSCFLEDGGGQRALPVLAYF